MPASDSTDPTPPQRPKPARRDPRLDAKPPRTRQATPARQQPASIAKPTAESVEAPRDLGAASKIVQQLRNPVVWGSATAGAVAVLALCCYLAFYAGSRPPVEASTPVVAQEVKTPPAPEVTSELRQPRQSIACQINTPEPGFVAFVDEQPVRDERGKIVLTPCEVTLEPGRHVIRVAKKGWNDIPRVTDVTKATTFEQEPTYEPFAETSSTFNVPYLEAAVGQPILLEPLVFKGRCQDPFVSSSGREIWYAASGPEGMGIYYSSRATSYDQWDTPSLLILSRGADLPASPSATDEGSLVSYTVPGKPGRVWGLTRTRADGSFDNKKPLHYVERGDAEWPSAQLSDDGKRLYWVEINKGKTTSWMASRYELEVEFNQGKKISLPGGIPCVSSDEMRQYLFDGKEVRRARRSKPTGTFGEPQLIASLDLPAYVPHPERRQFWVTDDEQWLYYAEDPATSGNLYVVRLSNGPGRGVIVKGRATKAKPAMVAKVEQPADDLDPESKPVIEEKPVVDPLSLPTPYAAFQLQVQELISKRDINGAYQVLQEAQQKVELQADRELLRWDAADLDALKAFWQAVESQAEKLKTGDTIRIGGTSFTLEKYADGLFALKTKTKTVERRLRELSAGDLLGLADKAIPQADSVGQLGVGIFLHYEGKAQTRASKSRLERAGSAGDEFREHLAVRRLKIIEQELARQNLSVALQQINELTAAYPDSSSAKTAEKHREQIYSYVKWDPRGSRKWEQGEDASYTATPEKQPGSLLVSSSDYAAFDLSLEWMTTSPTGQGGIYFRYPGQGKALDTAFKVHLANDAGVAADKFCTGSLFNYSAPTENAVHGSGQWNTLSLQVRGEKVTALINGKKVLDTLATDAAVPQRGYVALDGEFGGIVYREILLVEAAKSSKQAP